MKRIERRSFLGAVGAGLLGAACTSGSDLPSGGSGGDDATGGTGGGTGGGGAGGTSTTTTSGDPMTSSSSGQLECTETDNNIQGPFYRPDAPFKTDLTEPGMQGTRLTVSGQVLDEDCNPIAGAVVDVWQADDSGTYDNDGMNDPPNGEFVLRGRMTTDDDGNYSFTTIHPGRYLNGPQYRPSHIHVTVTADGHASLTTQLYFEGDPYNDVDAFIKPSLIMQIELDGDAEKCMFDFVLPVG